MKTFLRLIATATLVFFMSACGSSGGGGAGGGAGGGGAIEGAVQSGTYSVSFDGGASKTLYTSKVQSGNYIINTATYSGSSGSVSDSILIGATPAVGVDGANGSLLFTLYFPSGVTTGDLVLGQVQYRGSANATNYTYLKGMLGADIVANITEATNVNNVVHLKGSFSGTVYDGMDNTGNPNDPKLISVNFEFDAHRTDTEY